MIPPAATYISRLQTRLHLLLGPRRLCRSGKNDRITAPTPVVRQQRREGQGLATMNGVTHLSTVIRPVDAQNIGTVKTIADETDILDSLHINIDPSTPDGANLLHAADQLRHSDIPVAFPTETVYGLGADATRSATVQGIYKAKQRPADNPLIVHFASVRQLRNLLRPSRDAATEDPIPKIYHPLISRFWPGPLTIILPNPATSPLAPEVTAGLTTFGARIPRNILALALIQQANVPIAAPSANASTKPSPTAAEHVAYDLDGRIETILDGGPCDVGVESTVVDGLCDPPLVLRPGGVSLEQLRACPGWERTEIGYKNLAEEGEKPRAPGMKYRHYSPKAAVVLYESGRAPPGVKELAERGGGGSARVGVVTTKRWAVMSGNGIVATEPSGLNKQTNGVHAHGADGLHGFAGMLASLAATHTPRARMTSHAFQHEGSALEILEIPLGATTSDIARGIFAALRELDREDVGRIFVEGIEDGEGEIAAAVMNRLRKAAEVRMA